jgi:hypothetical protein
MSLYAIRLTEYRKWLIQVGLPDRSPETLLASPDSLSPAQRARLVEWQKVLSWDE